MSKDPLLKLLMAEARLNNAELAERLGMSEEAVRARLSEWEDEGKIVGYQAVVNTNESSDSRVCAFIEVKVTPERGGGFDRMAMRIAQFDAVKSCYLCSGGFDLLVIVEGENLLEVARFVSEKLSSMTGVLSTATHFQLKTYKENNFLFEKTGGEDRLSVTP